MWDLFYTIWLISNVAQTNENSEYVKWNMHNSISRDISTNEKKKTKKQIYRFCKQIPVEKKIVWHNNPIEHALTLAHSSCPYMGW